MNRFLTGLAVVLVVVAAGTVVQVLHGDPETTRPPHVARPMAGASGSLPLAAVGGDSPAGVVAEFDW